jgi:hypothetical protein
LRFHLLHLPTSGDGCLSALIDTSGGSDDNFVQSRANAVANAWVYHALNEIATLGEWIGSAHALSTAVTLRAKAAAIKKSFAKLMVNADGVVCDGLCAEVSV